MKKKLLFVITMVIFTDVSIQADQEFNHENKAQMIVACVRLLFSAACKSYNFFRRDNRIYDLQLDVLDHPYKKMLYVSAQEIDQLFQDANRHDNPPIQIKALILLCRVCVPVEYVKSFCKGLERLVALCFDEYGNFKDANQLPDIRLVFKDYCHKTLTSWESIAALSGWRCKNKQPYCLYTKYYAFTCTQYNEELLRMIQVDHIEDLAYLQYLLSKNSSLPAHKIYDYRIYQLLRVNSLPIDGNEYFDEL